MGTDATSASNSTSTSGGGASGGGGKEWGGEAGLWVENPFSFKVGQVFTGVGVGCGIGIGVGRPIYLGAIPALQQVMTATRGATDMFSGAGRHINSSLRKFGIKGVEAGIGCGVGIGHGFGVGLAIKPGVMQRIQSSVGQALVKLMTKVGMTSGIPSIQSGIPGPVQRNTDALSWTFDKTMQSSIANSLQMEAKNTGNMFTDPKTDGGLLSESRSAFVESKGASSHMPIVSHSEKVIGNFLQNPVMKNEKLMEFNEMAESLRCENNVLHVLLRHQQIMQQLLEENEKLRQILVEDLNISPSKLQTSRDRWSETKSACSDCFECRRKRSTR